MVATEVEKFPLKRMQIAWGRCRGSLKGGERAGGGGRGHISSLLFSFRLFLCSGLSCSYHLSAGMKGSMGGARPSSRLARMRRRY